MCGRETEIFTTVYSDRVMVIVTQMNKMGTMISAWEESSLAGSTTFCTRVLLGKRDDPALTICARQVRNPQIALTCFPSRHACHL